MTYDIVAESEEQARTILEDGGIDIDGDWHDCPSGELDIDSKDYKEALLVDETEIEEYE